MAKRLKPPATLQERAERTSAVIARFRKKPFDWTKAATCYHLAKAQLVAFGHKVPPVPAYRSVLGAKRVLKKLGHEKLEQLIDSHGLVRIPPAQMLVGDIALLPSDGPFEALAIYGGNGMVFGWHGTDMSKVEAVQVTGVDILVAWRA
jgi:hypothetical protein